MKECKFCSFEDQHLILKEYRYWTLSIAESQNLLGWSHAFLKRHVLFFEELTDEEIIELKKVISDLKFTLNKIFKPDWFNVMQLGNMTQHLHFQLVPRYKEKREFEGRIFFDKEYGRMIVDRWNPEEKQFLIKLNKFISRELK
jgi:diadenosine tetraphosphate (Ap4A) HIT family hydrolase